MKQKQKGNVAVIALIVVIVAISAGVIGYLFAQKSQAPAVAPAPVATTQPAVQTAAETANWKTYSNAKYGFEFKYPSGWKLEDSASSNVVALDNDTTPFGELNFSYFASLKDYTDLYKVNATSLDQIVLDKSLAFSDMKKIDFAGTKAWAGTEASSAGSYVIYVEKNAHVYKIEFATISLVSELSSADKNILSSFKFTTGSDETASWQTYANAKYGYIVKYPTAWFSYVDSASDVFIQPVKDVSHADAFEIKVSPTTGTADTIISDLGKQAGIQYVKTNIKIGGEDGVKIVSTCEGAGCGVPEWVLVKNGNFYHFVSNLGYSSEFDKILSTFKFTN
jgi:hypothetical protein